MYFAPNRRQTHNLIPQDLLVQKSIIKDARTTLQSNTPNNGIDCTLPQRFGFLPIPQTSKTSQHKLIQSFRARLVLIKDTKVFHKKSAIEQCENRCGIDSKLAPHIIHITGEIALCGL